MQKIITKYGLAAHLALLAVAPLFLSPTAVLWLAGLAAIWVFIEPSRVGSEMLHTARVRVARAVVRDPVFWVTLVVALVAFLRVFNDGVAMAYDAESAAWSLAGAKIPFLPGAVNDVAFKPFAALVALVVVVTGARNAMGRSARGAFLLLFSAFSAVGALTWVFLFRSAVPAAKALVASSLLTPSFLGSFFGCAFVSSVLSAAVVAENRWFKSVPLAALAIIGNGAGAFLFAPSTVTALYLVAAVVVILYSIVFLRFSVGHQSEFIMVLVLGFSIVLMLMFIYSILPVSALQERIEPVLTLKFVPESFAETRRALDSICLRVWQGSPWIGSGLGSFPLDLKFHATENEWMILSPLQATPLNAYWMILAERGVWGAFFLTVPFVLLLVNFIARIITGIRRGFPAPMAALGLLVWIAAFVEAAGDVSLLMPGFLLPLMAFMALSTNAFPKEKAKHV